MQVTSSQYLANKTIVPSELLTREWLASRALSAVKERAFVMAGVDNYATLKSFRDAAAMYDAGTLSAAQARQMMREHLRSSGYQAIPGTTGTIKDLSTTKRMDLVLETNSQMVRGYLQHEERKGSISYPAQELYRAKSARMPRDWDSRWMAASAQIGHVGVANNGEMIALNNSPIWMALSRFGTPYPPFDFNSSMRVRAVAFDRAEALGLMTDLAIKQIKNQRAASLNEDVEMSPRGLETDSQVMGELMDQLDGIAEWRVNNQGQGALRLCDPNGSRIYSATDLANIWDKADGKTQLYQQEALASWIKDQYNFSESNEARMLDPIQDFNMLIHRLEPMAVSDPGTTVFRGLKLSDESLNKIYKEGTYTSRNTQTAESWSTSVESAKTYASAYPESKTRNRVVLVLDDSSQMRNIQPLVQQMRDKNLIEYHTVGSPPEIDNEVLGLPGINYQVIKQYEQDGITYINLAR